MLNQLNIISRYDFRPASRLIIETRTRILPGLRGREDISTHTATLHPTTSITLETLLACLDLSDSIASSEPNDPGLRGEIATAREHLLSYYFAMNED